MPICVQPVPSFSCMHGPSNLIGLDHIFRVTIKDALLRNQKVGADIGVNFQILILVGALGKHLARR